MLERLTSTDLQARLGLSGEGSRPHAAAIARSARACVAAWCAPPRQRVTTYLTRQLIAAGFDADATREEVRDALDGLLDIGDLASVRLDGKPSLVMALATIVRVDNGRYVLLGAQAQERDEARGTLLARHVRSAGTGGHVQDFAEWLGPPGYRRHLDRRTRSQTQGALSELWPVLCAALEHEGLPIDPAKLRALVAPPGTANGYFGRYNQPAVSGRWSTQAPDGQWCAVRPGRNANEWHPILIDVAGSDIRALDLFDWDEWNWALLARGLVLGAPERQHWNETMLSFEHPVPDQVVRALRLLGGPSARAWTWDLDPESYACFAAWQAALN